MGFPLFCTLVKFLFFFLVTLAFGIPSIARERQSYLAGTLRSLLQGLTEEDKNDIVLIVFIGDVSALFITQMLVICC